MTNRAFHQLLPNYSARDAIGTDAVLIRSALRRHGFVSEIYCGDGYQSGDARPATNLANDLRVHGPDSSVMFHFSIGTHFSSLWPKYRCQKWIRYHNITPMRFFRRSDELHARQMCGLGIIQLRRVVEASDVVIADSAFNAMDVERYSKLPPVVVPIFRDYQALVSCKIVPEIQRQLLDQDVATVLFVGRVSPNKCHHDLLQLLALHKKTSLRRVRLIFAGSYFSDSYRKIIEEFARGLGLSLAVTWDFNADVMSLGSISDDELTTLYRSARLYASMSEHEGFGVPLVESMYFGLPVYAHQGSAVSEVLGGSEFLVNKFDWINALSTFETALFDDTARKRELDRISSWRERFSLAQAEAQLMSVVERHK